MRNSQASETRAIGLALALMTTGVASPLRGEAMPHVYDHIVIVVEENHGYDEIIGSQDAPFINRLARDGANLTRMFAEERHSQGNYHWLFSGDNQGIGFSSPGTVGPFDVPNLGSELIAAGLSFKGYSESLPEIGSTVDFFGAYARKHNPWVAFSNVPNGTTVETSSNLCFEDFPTDYSLLPTVSIVVPNQDNDMHNGVDPDRIGIGDAWLETNLGGYYEWARTHNSLLIVTFDEDCNALAGLTDPANPFNSNQIPTIFAGPGIVRGHYAEGNGATHVNLLRTIEAMYGLGHAGAQQPLATAAGITDGPITDVFALPGDTNADRIVDFSDLLVLAQSFGKATINSHTAADFNYDGQCNFDDLLIFCQHYSAGTDAALADFERARSVVPEPASSLALLLLLGRRRRRA